MPSEAVVEEYGRARDEFERAVSRYVPALVKAALARIADVLPACDQVEVLGEINEDWIPRLRVQRVLDQHGTVLFDVRSGHDSRAVEDTIDEVNVEYLDRLIDLTGDEHIGVTVIRDVDR